MARTEYFMIPLEHKFVLSGFYLGQKFNYWVGKENPEFKALFMSPLDGSTSSYHQFHKQMMWIKNNCPSLKDLPALPEPKPLPVCQPDPDLLEQLYVMKLMLGGTIFDLENVGAK